MILFTFPPCYPEYGLISQKVLIYKLQYKKSSETHPKLTSYEISFVPKNAAKPKSDAIVSWPTLNHG